MSRFFSSKHSALTPYTPGEQPKDRKFVKLNTNENPFPPSPNAVRLACEAAQKLELYSDPEVLPLREKFAEVYGIDKDEVVFVNGSDDILNFAFMAFCDKDHPAVFPDITYSFYKVFASLHHVPYEEIPLKEDFTVDVNDYIGIGKNIFIANPNAPTGMAISRDDVEKIVSSNPDNIVLIDEAYVDFGGESVIPLIRKYKNLFVTGTYSKSRSMAGARLGFGIADRELIADINTLRYSTNPYNINLMTTAAGIGSLTDEEYTKKNIGVIKENRAWTAAELEKLGFKVLPSCTNFVFAMHPSFSGECIYKELRERGVLIRHFNDERIKEYNRISIGTMDQMEALIDALKEIVK